ncbi:hypothetical protein ILYODFUR_037219 [Ilyodon furcidens]|uniref:Uncharacterized protein n=1 Tax=Ilyodon furcidens TaxID=33524 RepID=A0ABV0UYE2_9TELE
MTFFCGSGMGQERKSTPVSPSSGYIVQNIVQNMGIKDITKPERKKKRRGRSKIRPNRDRGRDPVVMGPPQGQICKGGQQPPTHNVNSDGEALLPPPEAPDSLPESLRGQPVVLLHGLTKLLPGPSFCLCHSPGCSILGVMVPSAASQSHKPTTASLTACVHHQVRGLPLRQAPQTLRPHLRAAASTIDVKNMVHSDSMSPTSPGIWSKLSRRWELNTSLAEGSARRSQQTLTMRLGLSSLSGFLLFQRIQLTTRW